MRSSSAESFSISNHSLPQEIRQMHDAQREPVLIHHGQHRDRPRLVLFHQRERRGRQLVLRDSLGLLRHEMLDRLVQEFSASIIPIPGIRGSIGVGLSAVRSSVERAVGMDIFSEK